MAKHFSTLKTITALTLFGVASFVCAEVVRCEAETGDVTYTDTVCGGNVQNSEFILVEKPLAKSVTYQQPSKAVQARASNWSSIYIAPRKGKVDAESVRSARLKMISLDETPRQWDPRK